MGDPRALAAGIAIQPEKKTVMQQIAETEVDKDRQQCTKTA
jgi:hypothetical protein